MKKSFLLAAVAVAALSSCTNEATVATPKAAAPAEQTLTFTATSDAATRSGIDAAAMKSFWSAKDAIAVFRASVTNGMNTAKKFTCNAAEGDATTTFTGSIAPDETGYTAVHPYIGGGWGTVASISVTQQQSPVAGSLDSNCDILWCKSEGFTLKFKRMVAVVNIILKNAPETIQGEKVKKLTFESTTGGFTGGYTSIDVTDGTVNPQDYSSYGEMYAIYAINKNIIANYTDETGYVINGEANTMLASYPTTIEAGSTLTITAQTDHYTMTKTATVGEAPIELVANKVVTFNVDLSTSTSTVVSSLDEAGTEDPNDGGQYDI